MVALASIQPDLPEELLEAERAEHAQYVEEIIHDLTIGKLAEADAVAQLAEATSVLLPSGVYPRLAARIIGHLCDAVSWGKHVEEGQFERRKLSQDAALSFFKSAATALGLNTREIFLHIAEEQVRGWQPYIKALSETLGADGPAIRLAGFNAIAKPRGVRGRGSFSIPTLVAYITDVLEPSMASGAKAQVYNRIAMKTLKWGVWHHRGEAAEQAAELVKTTKALFGDDRSGQRVKLVTDYINRHLAALGTDRYSDGAKSYRRGITFLIGLKDMPMSAKARGLVFENILKLAKDSGRVPERYRDRDEASIQDLVLEAVTAYVPEVTDKTHPTIAAQAQAMKNDAFEAYLAATENSLKPNEYGDNNENVTSVFAGLIKAGRDLGNAQRAYDAGLAIIDRAVAAGTVSKKQASAALNDFDIRYHASPKSKLDILDRVAAFILTDTTKGDNRSREGYMVLGQNIDGIAREDVAAVFSKHACRIRGADQMQQMQTVAEALDYGHARKDADITEAIAENIAIGRVGNNLAVVFTTALDDRGIERYVAIGRHVKTVSEHVREMEAQGAASAQVDEAATRVRELRALVLKAARANAGIGGLKAA